MAASEFEEGTMLPKIRRRGCIGDSAIRKVLDHKTLAEDATIGGGMAHSSRQNKN